MITTKNVTKCNIRGWFIYLLLGFERPGSSSWLRQVQDKALWQARGKLTSFRMSYRLDLLFNIGAIIWRFCLIWFQLFDSWGKATFRILIKTFGHFCCLSCLLEWLKGDSLLGFPLCYLKMWTGMYGDHFDQNVRSITIFDAWNVNNN